MGVVIIGGTAVKSFGNNKGHFERSVDEAFAALDLNHDGVLSRSELRRAFKSTQLVETDFCVDKATPPEELTRLYDSIFARFNCDTAAPVSHIHIPAPGKDIQDIFDKT